MTMASCELCSWFTECGALVEPQEVTGSKHSTDGCNNHVDTEDVDIEAFSRLVGREDCGELAPEACEAGKTKRCHRTEAKDPTELWHLHQHARETLDFKSVIALFHRTCHEEQHSGDETVCNHSEHCSVHTK